MVGHNQHGQGAKRPSNGPESADQSNFLPSDSTKDGTVSSGAILMMIMRKQQDWQQPTFIYLATAGLSRPEAETWTISSRASGREGTV